MPTSAIVPLQNITLSSAQSLVTFASIPTTGFRDLRLVITSRTASAAAIQMRLNGDTGSNYFRVVAQGSGSAANSNSSTAAEFYLGESSASATEYTVITADILDAFATDKHKSMISRNNYASAWVQLIASRWASTSAITSLSVFPSSSINFAAGSTFELFGVIF